jgi:NADH-quinone oxidoreductase subunit I
MKAALKEIYTGAKSLVIGMKITLCEFFKPTLTSRYPHQTLQIPERFRGHIQLTPNPDGGETLCIACKSCEKACPSSCIIVEGSKRATGGKKPDVFHLDFTRCSLCGLCVEACPVKPQKAIQHTKRYNLASPENSYKDMDLLKRFAEISPAKPATPPEAAPESSVPVPAAPVPAPAAPAAAPEQPKSQPSQKQ